MLQPTQQVRLGGMDATVEQIQTQTNAILTLSSTGGVITADGTEQTLYIDNEPLGCWRPRVMFIDLDNMLAGDTTVIRVYYRIADGGALLVWDYQSFSGVNGGLLDAITLIDINLHPNRHGFQITLQQTAGTNRAYTWELIAEM